MAKMESAKKIFDDTAENYDLLLQQNLAQYGKDTSYYSEYKVIRTSNFIKNPENILEFGCGTGRNLPFLKKYYPKAKISACDVSQKSLLIAKEQNSDVDFLNINEIVKKQLTYDFVFVANVLHHVIPSERNTVFSQIHSALKEAGEAIIFEHNPFNPLTVKAVNSCPFDEGVILLKPKEIINRAKQAGFKILQKQYCLFFPSALRIFSPVEKCLSFIPLGGQYFVRLKKQIDLAIN